MALNRGCYSIDITLYEAQALRTDAGNAIGLSTNQTDLIVGAGTCLDGVYTEAFQNEVVEGGESVEQSEATPGFGIGLALLALFFSVIIAARRQ